MLLFIYFYFFGKVLFRYYLEHWPGFMSKYDAFM